ncbi:hypothetical protein KCP73_01080 [Salmonella enterica subsp. enterica]|nr:hypothetical protein KCP73_01080 [Salmonella enterica subsp. enterica]
MPCITLLVWAANSSFILLLLFSAATPLSVAPPSSSDAIAGALPIILQREIHFQRALQIFERQWL